MVPAAVRNDEQALVHKEEDRERESKTRAALQYGGEYVEAK